MQLSTEQLKAALEKLPEGMRKDVEQLLTGKIISQVFCGRCKRHVANIYSDKKVKAVTDKKGVMSLLAYRYRLDGQLGFQCACGNDSRLCEAEKGIRGIEENQVQQSDIEEVFKRLQLSPAKFVQKDGTLIVDNFTIKDINGI